MSSSGFTYKFDRTPISVIIADGFEIILDVAFKLSVVAIAVKYVLGL